MTFVFENISEEIKQSVVLDADSDGKLCNLFQLAAKGSHFVKRRVIDIETGCYLMRSPSVVRDDRGGLNYLFYYFGAWYEFYLNSPFSDNARFRGEVSLTGSDLEALIRCIKDAFAVHGYFGIEDEREQVVVLQFDEGII